MFFEVYVWHFYHCNGENAFFHGNEIELFFDFTIANAKIPCLMVIILNDFLFLPL